MLDKEELLAQAKKYGIFIALIMSLALILVVTSLLSQNSWKKGLAVSMQETLNTFYPNTYLVEAPLPLKSTFSSSAQVYMVTIKKATDSAQMRCYGVIVRIPTIAGPAPAVFLYSKEKGIDFVGYALPYGKAETIFVSDIGLKIIQYWQQQVRDILHAAGVEV